MFSSLKINESITILSAYILWLNNELQYVLTTYRIQNVNAFIKKFKE
jgi:hypothetical protein